MANGNMRWVHGQGKKGIYEGIIDCNIYNFLTISKLSQALQSGSAEVCYIYSIKLPNGVWAISF